MKKKYVRATEATYEFYGINDEMVAVWLANGTNKWTNFRMFVKTVEKHVKQQERCKKIDPICSVYGYEEAVQALDVVYRSKLRR